MLTTMDYQKTVQALKRLRVETGSLACFGCGHEHNCSTQGCAILRNAVGHMEAALERATLTPPNEWVSVEERLPEKKQDVLMLFKSGNMAVGWWHDVDEHVTFWCAYTDDGFYTDCDDIPVYWMPLPDPPDRRPPEGAVSDVR